jgi:putative FmdB family regulatory protein
MPIYEYHCNACENCFEVLVFPGDSEKIHCPSCRSEDVSRQMSCVSIGGGGSGADCKSGSGGFS